MTQARDLADGKFDTNTLVVDAANNRVGIGITSPGRQVTINGGSSAATIALQTTNSGNTSSDGMLLQKDTDNSVYIWNQESSPMIFATNNTERMRILSGGGLTFNGDTATANALDDYEEGTWTPTDATGSGVTWTTHSARYTKIGRIVNVQLYISGISSSAASASAKISGLPYNVVNHGWTSSVLSTNAGQSQSQDIAVRSVSNSDDIDFKTASTDANIAWSHFHGAFMVFKLTYHVS